MSSRILISMLCVAAVAFACGPRPRSEATTTRAGTSAVAQITSNAAPVRQQGTARKTARAAKSPVTAQISVRKVETNLRFALRVVNVSKKKVEITFPNGQTYDFVVLDSVGREMWRWGSDRMFTQALRNKPLGVGESLNYEETLESDPLPPGRYTARATLTSANYPLVEETEFTVTATTIASR